ncbi:MAG TPA: tetratricopeptide repeat protein [Anaerolineales bacterium]|nr:tetratricopeptide repeat protein [Anaerolineales bacterium]
MPPSLNLSKVRTPRKRKGLVYRGRLLDSMHQGIERKLTHISAPAGYGKTSLLLDFQSEVDAVACWYQVTADDQTLADFVRYLTLALKQQYPEFGLQVERLVADSPNQVDPIQVAVEFINAVIQQVDDFTLLFIDDFHIVGEIEPIVVFVWHLLEHLPGQLRLVIASRNEYGIPTARLYVRGEITLLGKENLAFRAGEIQRIVSLVHHSKLSDEEAEELARRSDGWIVAILLAIRSDGGGPFAHFEGGTGQVYEFLAQEVLRNEPEHLRDFMLATSIVDEFSIELGNHLARLDHAADLIADLDRRNLFLVQIETAQRTTYRYHQLFQDFLRNYLETRDPDRKIRLHDRAAEWFGALGDWEKAIEHKLAAGDRRRAAEWMNPVAKNLYIAGRNNVLAAWMDALAAPPDLSEHAPELLLNQAKVLINQGNFNRAEALLAVAEPIFEAAGLTDQQKNTMITRGMGYLQKGRFQEALDLNGRWQRAWPTAVETDFDLFRQYQMDRIEGLARATTGDPSSGLVLLKGAVEGLQALLEKASDSNTAADPDGSPQAVDTRTLSHDLDLTQTTLGVVCYQMGLIQNAQAAFQRALDLQRRTGTNRRQMATALNNLGYLYNLTGQYALSVPLLREALEIIRPHSRAGSDIVIYNSWGEWLLDIGELDEAESYLRSALQIAEPLNDPPLVGRTFALLARLEALRGDFNQAFHYLREGARVRDAMDTTPEYQLLNGLIRLEMGQPELARSAFQAVLDRYGISAHPTQTQAQASFLLGAVLYRQGDQAEALNWLQKTLSWTAILGYDQFLVVLGRHMPDFLAFAQKMLKDNLQLNSLIERVKKFKTGLDAYESLDPETEPEKTYRLEVFGFGAGRVVVNGVAIANSDWRAAKSREIFFYLLDSGGSRSAGIKLEFWPDRDPIRATSVFQSTLWRARQALGAGEILVLDGEHYRIAPQVVVWYDVAEFENMIRTASELRDSPRRRSHLLQNALSLYSGDFLENVFSDWTEERRSRLRMDYLAALLDLAGLESDAGHLHKARGLYEQIVQIDPYHDDAQLAIAALMIKQGRPNAAREYCRKVVSFLESEGLSPSIEFTRYFRDISG